MKKIIPFLISILSAVSVFADDTKPSCSKPVCTIDVVNTSISSRYVLYKDNQPVRSYDGSENGYQQAIKNANTLEKAGVCTLIE